MLLPGYIPEEITLYFSFIPKYVEEGNGYLLLKQPYLVTQVNMQQLKHTFTQKSPAM